MCNQKSTGTQYNWIEPLHFVYCYFNLGVIPSGCDWRDLILIMDISLCSIGIIFLFIIYILHSGSNISVCECQLHCSWLVQMSSLWYLWRASVYCVSSRHINVWVEESKWCNKIRWHWYKGLNISPWKMKKLLGDICQLFTVPVPCNNNRSLHFSFVSLSY